MSCQACEQAVARAEVMFPFRLGNDEDGYGNIALLGCRTHVKLAMERLRGQSE